MFTNSGLGQRSRQGLHPRVRHLGAGAGLALTTTQSRCSPYRRQELIFLTRVRRLEIAKSAYLSKSY